ncbi:T9SS type A sorting domain-containing protein [Candidatus Cloacimonadota bacterium]
MNKNAVLLVVFMLMASYLISLEPPNNLLVNEDGYATWELPGAGPQDIFSDDFENGLVNWTVVNNATGEWLAYSHPYPNAYQMPPASLGTTVCAADADENYPIDSELILQTALDLTGFYTVTLEFDNDFNVYNINDWAYVDVSNDFGATWNNLIAWNTDVSETHEVVDLTTYAAGFDGVLIRFYSVQPDWDYWWAIDNVYIHGIATENDDESSRDLLGYNVYLDTSFITYTTDLFYQYTGLIDGQTYLAEVTALYDEGESLPAEYSFTYIDNNPIIQVSPLTINETLEPDEQVVVPVTISNMGTGSLIYDINVSLYPLIPFERNNYLHREPSVVSNNGFYDEIDPNGKIVEFPSNTDDQFDVQLAVPTGVGGGEAGFETDGTYMYTTDWNGIELYRYDMSGNYIETFLITGVSSVRDLAYDGTYFYGAAANTNLYQMDFTPGQESLVSTIAAPVSCRAIAYDSDENGFWANNYSTDMTLFDMNGNVLNSFPCGTAGSFYGLAYDNFSAYGPYLWGFSQFPPNAIVQFDIATGLETGLTFDVGAAVGSSGSAGGLFIEPNIFPGTVSIGCLIQNEWLVLLELADYADPWLYCDVYNGTIPAGQSATVNVTLDAADLADIVKEGYLTIESNGGADEIVEVIMNVNPIITPTLPPTNFAGTVQNFNDVLLTWEPPALNPENRDESRALLGYTIYQDGTVIGTVDLNTLEFLYEALDAGTYNYTIVANYDEGDSDPAGPVEITITLPAPANVIAASNWPNISLSWNAPTESRDIVSYNVYQDNAQITNTTETSYEHENVPAGTYIYNVAAVYDGNWEGELSDDAEVVHENPNGADPNLIPMITTLEGNFPNPFNPTTTIKFGLHEDQQVAIIIYNIKGEKVRTLVNDELNTGYYNMLWNGKDDNNKPASSGIYFYKMKAGDYQETKKMILMK